MLLNKQQEVWSYSLWNALCLHRSVCTIRYDTCT